MLNLFSIDRAVHPTILLPRQLHTLSMRGVIERFHHMFPSVSKRLFSPPHKQQCDSSQSRITFFSCAICTTFGLSALLREKKMSTYLMLFVTSSILHEECMWKHVTNQGMNFHMCIRSGNDVVSNVIRRYGVWKDCLHKKKVPR